MRSCSISLIFLCFVSIITASDVNQIKARTFRNRYTTTFVKTHVITSFIPSSCVQVDATLPPCKTLRSIQSFPVIEGRSNSNNSYANITTNATTLEETLETTPLSWGEYLGIYAPTVTVTSTKITTTTMVDPGVQVTYAIRGCKPKTLPEGMERCSIIDEEIISPVITSTSASIQIEATPTLPSSTMIPSTSTAAPTTTSKFKKDPTTSNNDMNSFTSTTIDISTVELEGSPTTTEEYTSSSLFNTPTENLKEVTTINP